jgi:hypothetical protein
MSTSKKIHFNAPDAAPAVAAPRAAQSTTGLTGVNAFTGSTTSMAIKVPPELHGAYVDLTANDTAFQYAFSTGSSIPTLTFGATSTISSDGSPTTNVARGKTIQADAVRTFMCPFPADGVTNLYLAYVQKVTLNTTGSIEFDLSDQHRFDISGG